jgi:hypothetical protein
MCSFYVIYVVTLFYKVCQTCDSLTCTDSRNWFIWELREYNLLKFQENSIDIKGLYKLKENL